MKPLRRVLVVHPYGIGDLLFVTPVLRALRLVPGIETVDLLLGSRTGVVVQSNPHADEIFSVDKDKIHGQSFWDTLADLRALGKKLRRKKYDLMLDYSLRGEYAFLGRFFLGIPRTAGFDYKRRGFFHTVRFALPQGFKGRHVVDYFCDLAEKAGVTVQDRFCEFYVAETDRAEAAKFLEAKNFSQTRLILVSPGGGESWGKDANFKRWPVPYWAGFLERLSREAGDAAVVILGSAQEKNLAEELKKILKMPALNAAGALSLGAVAALMEKALIFTGNDGGLVHLAHALDTPVVAFYGPVDPAVYGPYPPSDEAVAVFKENLECRPCYQKFRYNAACTGRECLQALSPEEAWPLVTRKDFLRRALAVV